MERQSMGYRIQLQASQLRSILWSWKRSILILPGILTPISSKKCQVFPNCKLPWPHPLLQNLHPLGQGSHVCSTHPLGIRWNQNLFKIIPRTFHKDSSINTKTLQTPLLILSVQALAPGRQLPWQQTWTDKDECCAQCRAFSPTCLKNVAPAWPFIRARHVDSPR